MRLTFNNFKLKKDLDRIQFLHWGQFSCVVIALLVEMSQGFLGVSGVVEMALLFVLYNMYFRTARRLLYTFWTFAGINLIYLLLGLFQAYFVFSHSGLTNLYILAIVFLAVEVYVFSSPIYFPRVSWWEYDFRYREDLKIQVRQDDKEFRGRLTDLRRGAGCIVLFENIKIGDFVDVIAKDEKGIELKLVVEIMSRREYSIGRGFTYGVKFHFENEDLKKQFKTFTNYWKSERRVKQKMKFSREGSLS